MSHNLRFRQVHLDFHTSPHIPGIGQGFDKDKWQKTLKAGHVDSITCFATCHHGWAYFDSKFDNRHPHLEFDLLRRQFEACKEIDVNVPIYLTAGVNNWASANHPEWREINNQGRYAGWSPGPLTPGFHKMCFNTPYLDLLCDQISEVSREFPNCDGIFLDIIHQGPCCCPACMKSMEEQGYDAENEADQLAHARKVLENYYKRTTAAAKIDDPDMPVFHNSGHITQGDTKILEYFSHLELESLPTGGWGYDHFPMSAKYCAKLGKDFLGMTGKFHTTWGEFGGYKHPNALRYECAAMIAMGAKCSVGDQLHPAGNLDESTYQIIGAAYKEVEEKEAWCDNTTNMADIAILSCVATNKSTERESAADIGAGRMLLESHMLFDIIDTEMEFGKYKALILPDDINVDETLKKKLDAFLSRGGKLILSGDSGLNADKSDFIWDIGASFKGASEFQPDYALPSPDAQPDFCQSPMVMYIKSNKIKATTGQSLGQIYYPYFNRTFAHFCSHQHTPYQPEASGYDCAVATDNVLYFAHPIFSIYRWYGAVAYKDYAIKAIKKFLGTANSLDTNLPSTARLTLMNQETEKRYVLHLLYASTISRGGQLEMSGGNIRNTKPIEVIEDLLPLYNTEVKLKTEQTVKKVTLEPQGIEIPFTNCEDDRIKVVIDKFECHQMVVCHY